jgi:hypothetical protein
MKVTSSIVGYQCYQLNVNIRIYTFIILDVVLRGCET